MTVHLFGATSSPSCASYALRKTATDNQEHFSPEELCKMNLGWDEEVPPHIREQWSKWSAGFPLMSNFKVQRCFKTAGFGSVTQAQLHHFADASDQGYGTATYLRLQNDQNNIHVALVMGKGRVAPLKRMTIPRMELAAAVLATKVDKMLTSSLQLQLDRSVFWTDSQSVIKYIANEHSRFKTFVANRVAAIRDASEVCQWNYIDTKSNPADDATRGQSAEKFLSNKRWLHGPDILWEAEQKWPVDTKPTTSLAPDDPEVKRTHIVSTTLHHTTGENATHTLITHYSDWTKLRVAVSWFLKLKETLRKLVQITKQGKMMTRNMMNKPDYKLGGQQVNVQDLKAAEIAIARFVQSQHYPDELKSLATKSPEVKRESTLYKLDPTLMDGIIRVGGRLKRMAIGEDRKCPIIIPKNSHVAKLILGHVHRITGHGGRSHMLSELCRKYWISNANSAARKILSKCVCRRYKARAGEQMMSDLPQERLQPDLPPFTNTGVDYFGPFEVKRGRSLAKRYGVLFTCMTSRAIHIEVANSLDTSSCINALRRFICRRGQVKYLRSDNGTNFVGANAELQKALSTLDQDKVHSTLRTMGIEWTFNPPGASHHGGIWERLIRSIRQVLCSILKQQTLDDEGLQTVFCEVEAILNSRPLTTVTNDPQDLTPLTPNDLLLLNARPVLPPGTFEKSDQYTRRRWRQAQYLANIFWRRWTSEYVPLLQERQKWNTKKRNFQCGDLVLVVDPTAPRSSWTLGRIIEVYPDRRGMVRTAKIKTQTNIIQRPITKLCLMLEGEET
ncbi:uncharacterized protein LOC134463029 isoform X1 [Engraulis encrasicolus]|uniref:uncharacterized protein LOC134463029 isoform X1 n=1 Tax=Engraulis encrasicolus TaxID=184585 RepID=UPI002FD4B241